MAFSTEKNKTQYTPPIPDYSSFSANALDFNNSVSPQSSPSTFKFEPLNLTGLGEDWLTKNWASNPTSQTPGAYDFSKAQLGNYNPMASMAPMASQNSVNPVNPNNSGFWSNPLTTTNIDKNGVVTENQGFLGPVFDGLGAVSNIYFGMKGLDLAEEQFDFQKEAFEKNYEANKLAFNNAVRRRGDAAANAVSNEVLGISDNATLAERAAAEEAYSTSQTANKVI